MHEFFPPKHHIKLDILLWFQDQPKPYLRNFHDIQEYRESTQIRTEAILRMPIQERQEIQELLKLNPDMCIRVVNSVTYDQFETAVRKSISAIRLWETSYQLIWGKWKKSLETTEVRRFIWSELGNKIKSASFARRGNWVTAVSLAFHNKENAHLYFGR